MSWKDWQIGEVVTESDFQNLVQDQVVQRYADSSARSTTLGTAVAEGMVSYLEDTNKVQVYTGSDWVDVGQEGDITAVTAGTALSGGGTAGDVTLDVDIAAVGSAIAINSDQVTDLTTGTAGQLAISAGTAGLTFEDAEATLVAGTAGYTALSNGTAGISYQPVSHNYIINGAFDVAQRGTTFTDVNFTYHLDRWQAGRGGFVSGLNISRVAAGLDGFRYAMRVQRAPGNSDTNNIRNAYVLETADSIPLAGKTVTLSFYARKGADWSTTDLDVALVSGTGTDQGNIATSDNFASGPATVIGSGATLTTSWARYTWTGTVATTATQLAIRIRNLTSGTAGANDYYEITGVQLEAGSIATPFKRNANSLQGELAACQRYYQRFSAELPNYYIGGRGNASSTTNVVMQYPTIVEMRVKPSSVDFSALRVYDEVSAIPVSTATVAALANTKLLQAALTCSGATQYRSYTTVSQGGSAGYIGFSAEL